MTKRTPAHLRTFCGGHEVDAAEVVMACHVCARIARAPIPKPMPHVLISAGGSGIWRCTTCGTERIG
jgi:hypothetical protein